jgi:hypothetical protein
LGFDCRSVASGPVGDARGFLGADVAKEGFSPPFPGGSVSQFGCSGLFEEDVAHDKAALSLAVDAVGLGAAGLRAAGLAGLGLAGLELPSLGLAGLGLDIEAFGGIHGHDDCGCGQAMDDRHEGSAQNHTKAAPVGGVFAGAVGEEFLLPCLAAVCAFARGAEQQAERSPEGGLLAHGWLIS